MSIEFQEHTTGASYKGTFTYEEDGVLQDLTGWTCQMQLRKYSSGAIANGVDRPITTYANGNTAFTFTLTPAETSLANGLYVIAADLTETATGDKQEAQVGIEIKRDWAQ